MTGHAPQALGNRETPTVGAWNRNAGGPRSCTRLPDKSTFSGAAATGAESGDHQRREALHAPMRAALAHPSGPAVSEEPKTWTWAAAALWCSWRSTHGRRGRRR